MRNVIIELELPVLISMKTLEKMLGVIGHEELVKNGLPIWAKWKDISNELNEYVLSKIKNEFDNFYSTIKEDVVINGLFKLKNVQPFQRELVYEFDFYEVIERQQLKFGYRTIRGEKLYSLKVNVKLV